MKSLESVVEELKKYLADKGEPDFLAFVSDIAQSILESEVSTCGQFDDEPEDEYTTRILIRAFGTVDMAEVRDQLLESARAWKRSSNAQTRSGIAKVFPKQNSNTTLTL